MANWNKKIGLSVLSLGLLAMTPNVASANDCYSCDPCCDPCSLGGFEVGVDFIYWKPCYDNTEWAVKEYSTTGTTTPVTTEYHSNYQGICPSWEPGVRARVAKRDIFCDWTLSGSYTWIHSTDNCSVHSNGTRGSSSDFVTSPLFAPGIANNFSSTTDFVTFTEGEVSWKSNYQTWDVLLSYDFNCNRCSTFTPFFGVEGLILSQQLDADFEYYDDTNSGSGSGSGSSGTSVASSGSGLVDEAAWVNWKSSYFGVGLKLGTDYMFNLFDCLKLFARASGSIVVGNNDSSSHQGYKYGNGTGAATLQTLGRYKDDDCCLIVPGYNIAVGVQYDSCWCGTDVALRLGWEFVQWFNVANPRSYSSNSFLNTANAGFATVASSGNTSTIGYQGLTVGLDVRF